MKIAKIIRVVALVFFIAAIVVASFAFLGSFLVPACANLAWFDGKTLDQFLLDKGTNVLSVSIWCVAATLYFAYGAFSSKLVEKYFKKVLGEGTPFKSELAKNMRKLAFTLLISDFAAMTSIGLFVAIVQGLNKTIQGVNFSYGLPIGFAVGLLIISLFIEYAIETEAKHVRQIDTNPDDASENEQPSESK